MLVRWAALALASLLSACGGVIERDGASTPPVPSASVPDAVPRAEPRSRYGNPESYVVNGRRYYTLRTSHGYVERGIASWYGKKFHGRRTSSGERYDMFAMTAAHKTLPLPSYARVTNLRTGRHVVVRVNDRGPFHENRLIDLSYTAAEKLGIVREGTGLVEVRVVDGSEPAPTLVEASAAPAPAPRPGAEAELTLFLQAGAFSVRGNAERLAARLRTVAGALVQISDVAAGGRTLYRVRLGPLVGVTEADRLVQSIVAMGLETPHIVIE